MKKTHRKLINNQRGQGLIEYLILVALMGVATIGIVRVMGSTVSGKFAQVTGALQGRGRERQINFQTIEERHYSTKDMSNFINGASSGTQRGNGNEGSQ